MKLKIMSLVLTGVLGFPGHKEPPPLKEPFMVWDSNCLSSLEKTKKTTLVAPMKDGKPDMMNSRLTDVLTTYDPLCGHIEMRRTVH